MFSLKTQLIRLGNTNPELRGHLRPVLAELDKTSDSAPKLEQEIFDFGLDILRGDTSYQAANADEAFGIAAEKIKDLYLDTLVLIGRSRQSKKKLEIWAKTEGLI